jgi:hypothetical protein
VVKGSQLTLTVGEIGGGRIELSYTGSSLVSDTWIGLVLTWNGYQSTTMTSADASNAYTLNLVDRESSVITPLVWGTVQVTNSASLLLSGANHRHVVGAGALVGDVWGNAERQVFQGSIASHVATTLLANAPLPTYDELALMLRDPLQWVQSYKMGQPWRSPGGPATITSSPFPTSGENGTRIWLMGDGVYPTGAEVFDDFTKVYNQAHSSGTPGALQLEGFGPNNLGGLTMPTSFEDPVPVVLGPVEWFTYNGSGSLSVPNLQFTEMNEGASVTFEHGGEYVTVFEWAEAMNEGPTTIAFTVLSQGKLQVSVVGISTGNIGDVYMTFDMKWDPMLSLMEVNHSIGGFQGVYGAVSFYTTIPTSNDNSTWVPT